MNKKAKHQPHSRQQTVTNGLESYQLEQYYALQSIGINHVLNNLKRMSRNVLYICSCKNIHRRATFYFVDLFRDKSKPSLLAFYNFIHAFDVDANDIFKRDLVIDDIRAGKLHPKFNYETYKLPTDII